MLLRYACRAQRAVVTGRAARASPAQQAALGRGARAQHVAVASTSRLLAKRAASPALGGSLGDDLSSATLHVWIARLGRS